MKNSINKTKASSLLLLVLGVICLQLSCRKDPNPYGKYQNQEALAKRYKKAIIVYFKDKGTDNYALHDAAQFLSERSLNRRKKQGIPIDSTDLPVSKSYIDQVLKAYDARLLNSSKWLNYAVIHLPEGQNIAELKNLPFVSKTQAIGDHLEFEEPLLPPDENESPLAPITSTSILSNLSPTSANYGKTFKLLEQYQASFLHEKQFYGEDKLIAILADGFGYLAEKKEISHLLKENKITHTYDFIYNKKDISHTSSSGNNHLGILAALHPENYIGMAPKASFALLRTDMSGTQEPFFETSWVAGMEFADSIGVDIVSSSCIYGVQYNDPSYDISAANADGTAISSRTADLAFHKGIITVQMFPQKSNTIDFVIPPADARDILAVGNLNSRNTALWSVLNRPTKDGRIKPELGALAQEIPIIYDWSESYSTSHTPPILAGLIACLWQAMPDKTAKEIRTMLLQTASQQQKPDNILGYGIPNFKKVYETYK